MIRNIALFAGSCKEIDKCICVYAEGVVKDSRNLIDVVQQINEAITATNDKNNILLSVVVKV